MKIVFFNHYHNGDIHVSRGFVRKLMEYFPDNSFFYSHKNSQNLLSDIPNLILDPNAINKVKDFNNLIRVNDTVYVNTWYGQLNRKYLNSYGITFDSLYVAFDNSCRSLFNKSLNNISQNPIDFFPIIDYNKFQIESARKWLEGHPEPKILVETGYSQSGQSHNFGMIPIIEKIASLNKDKLFILSNKEYNTSASNIFYTSDIICKKYQSDLNEISFLSEHCDTIIGRASGVFSYCMTYNNLFKKHTKYICFCNLPSATNKFWLGPLMQSRINYTASIIVNNTSNIDNVFNTIKGSL